MKITVVGAGAIGGWIAARLALAGHEPTILVRPGRTFDTLVLHECGKARQATLRAIDNAANEEPQDAVIFAVKAFALADAAEAAEPLIGPDTIVVPLVNGVPWWFADPPLASVDPGGPIGRTLPLGQVVGSVVHAAVRRDEPGSITVQHADKLIVGELHDRSTARVERLAALLTGAGIATMVSSQIRRDIWYKAWGNMTMNPLSALTLATTDRIIIECRPLSKDKRWSLKQIIESIS